MSELVQNRMEIEGHEKNSGGCSRIICVTGERDETGRTEAAIGATFLFFVILHPLFTTSHVNDVDIFRGRMTDSAGNTKRVQCLWVKMNNAAKRDA